MADSKIEYTPLERNSVDLESLPDYEEVPKWHRQSTNSTTTRRPSRRSLAVAGILVLALPTVFFSLPRFGVHPLKCMKVLPETRPDETSMCDYYATQNYYWNSAATQKALVKAIVDKAFVGAKNPKAYFGYETGQYNGILRAGDYFGANVDLTTYFDGSRNTTNVDGEATNVSFFTGHTFTKYGREYPAGNCKFHHMLEGMYKYVAPMLGCSAYGNTVSRYSGRSMAEIHKFMDFSNNWDWMYFIHQLGMGALAAKFSDMDAATFELYLVDKFGPKLDKKNKKVVPAFENPELEKSTLPPKLDAADIMLPDYKWKRVEIVPDRVQRREDYSSTPPPLTTPVLAASSTVTSTPDSNDSEATAQSVPSNILPIALGAGIGAGVGVIIIAVVIAYLVIRKKKISKRQSTPSFGIKSGNIEMQKGTDNTNRRVDRSASGKVVGKPKDYQPPAEEAPQEKPKGHRKNESIGVRSVRFSQQEVNK